MDFIDHRRGWVALVPNVLSLLRLLLAVLFPFLPARWLAAVILLAGLSDLADGLIARRFKVTSWVGGLVDGFADKAFVLIVLITLAVQGEIILWRAGLLLCRDMVVVAIVSYAVIRGQWVAFRRMPARLLGKMTTAAMFVLFLFVVLNPDADAGDVVLFCFGAALSVAAGTDYLIQFVLAYRDV